MKKGEIALESLRTTYRKKIWSKFVKAIKDFNLIEDGDRIAVGVSGGKDSLLLCKLFQEMKKDRSKNFEVAFISMNPGFEALDMEKFKTNLEELGIPCEVFEANVWEIAFKEDPESPCFLCAKMRGPDVPSLFLCPFLPGRPLLPMSSSLKTFPCNSHKFRNSTPRSAGNSAMPSAGRRPGTSTSGLPEPQTLRCWAQNGLRP